MYIHTTGMHTHTYKCNTYIHLYIRILQSFGSYRACKTRLRGTVLEVYLQLHSCNIWICHSIHSPAKSSICVYVWACVHTCSIWIHCSSHSPAKMKYMYVCVSVFVEFQPTCLILSTWSRGKTTILWVCAHSWPEHVLILAHMLARTSFLKIL